MARRAQAVVLDGEWSDGSPHRGRGILDISSLMIPSNDGHLIPPPKSRSEESPYASREKVSSLAFELTTGERRPSLQELLITCWSVLSQ